MINCPLYNDNNLDFTGKENPFGLIQKGGKKKLKKRSKKTMRKKNKGRKTKKNNR